jgi:hypothetical protein
MRTLCQSVDACIRSSGPMNANSFAADTLKRAFDMILNRVAMGLALPPGKSSPVVSYDEFQSSLHRNLMTVTSDR